MKSKYLYLHVLIHTILSFISLELRTLVGSCFGGISHFIIDAAKLSFQTIKNKKRWFFIDQALHIIVIAGVSFLFNEFNFEFLKNQDF
jgi:hypothetical protein